MNKKRLIAVLLTAAVMTLTIACSGGEEYVSLSEMIKQGEQQTVVVTKEEKNETTVTPAQEPEVTKAPEVTDDPIGTLLPGNGNSPEAPSEPEDVTPAIQSDGLLRFDGLYCYITDYDNDGKKDNYCLRFYEDKTVVKVTVEAGADDPEDCFPDGNWFNYDFENRGTYEYDGTSISFSTESPEGVVEYNGTVYEDKLTLVSHSYINGRISDEEDYFFYPFTEIPDYVP